MGLIGESMEPGVARPGVPAVNQRRHDHLATVFRQPPRELGLGRDAGCQSGQHFGRLIGVRDRDNTRDDLPGRLEKEPFAMNVVEDRPTHGVHAVTISFGDNRQRGGAVDIFQRVDAASRIHRADAALKIATVGLHGFLIGIG